VIGQIRMGRLRSGLRAACNLRGRPAIGEMPVPVSSHLLHPGLLARFPNDHGSPVICQQNGGETGALSRSALSPRSVLLPCC